MNAPPIPAPIRATAADRLRPLRIVEHRELRPRRIRLRLWLPVSLLWVVLAPLALLALPLLAAAPPLRRIGPVRGLAAIAGVLFALSGTVVEVEAPEASIRIRLF